MPILLALHKLTSIFLPSRKSIIPYLKIIFGAWFTVVFAVSLLPNLE